VFVIEEKKHPRFERVDDDLTVTLNITLSQALLGPDGGGEITKEVNQLDGRRIPVTLPAGVGQFRAHLGHHLHTDRTTWSNHQDRRRRYARFKGRIRKEARRSSGQVECCLPVGDQQYTKAGATQSPRLDSEINTQDDGSGAGGVDDCRIHRIVALVPMNDPVRRQCLCLNCEFSLLYTLSSD